MLVAATRRSNISCIRSRRCTDVLDHLRLTSGYLSRIAGKEIFVLEDRCMGKGDAACHLSAARARNGVTNAPRSCTSSAEPPQRVPRCFARAGSPRRESGRAEA